MVQRMNEKKKTDGEENAREEGYGREKERQRREREESKDTKKKKEKKEKEEEKSGQHWQDEANGVWHTPHAIIME